MLEEKDFTEKNSTETPPQVPSTEKEGAAPAGLGRNGNALQTIRQLGQVQIPQMDPNIFCLNIIGQIEGHLVMSPHNKTTKYEHVIPQIVAAEQSDQVEGVIIVLNTVGGDVEAGLAIAEMISTMSKPTVSVVLGGGHSIGVPIAVAAETSFIAETATMTIHPVRLTGLVVGVPQTFEYLEKMQDRVTRFVTRHSDVTEESFRELMFKTGQLARDIGTNLIGEEAVRHGLISRVGGIADALYKLNQGIEERRQHREQLEREMAKEMGENREGVLDA